MLLVSRGPDHMGAGLARFLQAKGHTVVEVNRPNRQLRHQNGKSDPLDAESAARAVLGGQANARPKSADSSVEMIRHLKVARDTAVKSRTQAMVTLKTIIINAPAALRQALDRIIGKMALIRHLAALRPGPILSVTASAKGALRAIARRWLTLDAEIRAHDADLEALTASCVPAMLEAHGISTGTAAEMLILVGDNPERIRSEPLSPNSAASVRFQPRAAKRTAIASIGEATDRPMLPVSGRDRPNAESPADPRLRQKAQSRWQRQNGNHPLSQAIRGPRDLRLFMRRSNDRCLRFRKPLDRYRSINAPMESCFGTIKNRTRATTLAIQPGKLPGMTCFAYIEGYYNRQRLHSALGISLPNRQSAKPLDPVSTKSGEGQSDKRRIRFRLKSSALSARRCSGCPASPRTGREADSTSNRAPMSGSQPKLVRSRKRTIRSAEGFSTS